MPKRTARPQDGEHFQSAIANWQLELQTELKKASSLPTAMFDACDPMLEARLAEATESLFRSLLEQQAPSEQKKPQQERRLESVATAELAALFTATARDGAADPAGETPPQLTDHRDDEFLGILGETCLRAPAAQQERAKELLKQASRVAGDGLEDFATAIARQLVQNKDYAAIDPKALAATCHRIAVAVLGGGQGMQP